MMMMMKYKLANKRNKRLSMHNASENDGMVGGVTCPVTPIQMAMQPKRVSMGSTSGGRDDDLAYVSSDMVECPMTMTSPIPTFKELSTYHCVTKKPTKKMAPPSDNCFAPISASRRLNFAKPKEPITLDGRDWSLQPPTPRAAIVSPRNTPVSAVGPSFEESQHQVYKSHAGFPPALYIPTSEEQTAATILMFLKDMQHEGEKKTRGPLLYAPPKRRRTSKISWDENLIIDEDDNDDEFDKDDDSSSEETSSAYEEHDKKRRKFDHLASSRKLHVNIKRCTNVPSICSRGRRITVEATNPKPSTSSGDNERAALLAAPTDAQHLNSLHCFVRSDLLEIFVMDEHTRKHRGSAPRVGIRCTHCGKLPRKEKEGASMSIFYPKSLQDIYRSVCTWQRIHFKACKHVPQELVERYNYLKDMDRTRGKKHHWVNSAYKLGLRNLDENRGGIVWRSKDEQ